MFGYSISGFRCPVHCLILPFLFYSVSNWPSGWDKGVCEINQHGKLQGFEAVWMGLWIDLFSLPRKHDSFGSYDDDNGIIAGKTPILVIYMTTS